jgi:hypothetical protein
MEKELNNMPHNEEQKKIEVIIKKAIEGGWKEGEIVNIQKYATKPSSVTIGDITDPKEFIQGKAIVLDPLFWQALFPNNWTKTSVEGNWKTYAIRFHEINLSKGWDEAINYLFELLK